MNEEGVAARATSAVWVVRDVARKDDIYAVGLAFMYRAGEWVCLV